MICKEHSSYKGLSRPSGNNAECLKCWQIYADMLEWQVLNLERYLQEKKKKLEKLEE